MSAVIDQRRNIESSGKFYTIKYKLEGISQSKSKSEKLEA